MRMQANNRKGKRGMKGKRRKGKGEEKKGKGIRKGKKKTVKGKRILGERIEGKTVAVLKLWGQKGGSKNFSGATLSATHNFKVISFVLTTLNSQNGRFFHGFTQSWGGAA